MSSSAIRPPLIAKPRTAKAVRRRELFKDDEHGRPDRIGEDRLLLGIGTVGWADDRIGDMEPNRILAAALGVRADEIGREVVARLMLRLQAKR
jgi:hypothetical protein